MGPDRVLITRPEPGASETAARVADLGCFPILAPFLEIRPTRVRLPSVSQIAAILLASGSAVAPLPAAYHAVPALTVGDATTRRAEHAGFADVTSAGGDAVALAALVRSRVAPGSGTLLLAAAQGQSLALAADLRASGYRVMRRVVYAAAPVAALPEAARLSLADDRPVTVLFFSAETARHFMRLVRAAGLTDHLRNHAAVTIGAPSAMALKGVPWARIRVAGKPTQDEMLALLR
jgi:uroporphyrinogen-III synthase